MLEMLQMILGMLQTILGRGLVLVERSVETDTLKDTGAPTHRMPGMPEEILGILEIVGV